MIRSRGLSVNLVPERTLLWQMNVLVRMFRPLYATATLNFRNQLLITVRREGFEVRQKVDGVPRCFIYCSSNWFQTKVLFSFHVEISIKIKQDEIYKTPFLPSHCDVLKTAQFFC
jgi:hypothetical protein